jgi:hypothetical protein
MYCHLFGVCVTNKMEFGFEDRIYWTFIQLVTAVHKSLSDRVIFFRLDAPLELFWLPTELNWTELLIESESYVTTDGQPASLFWNKAPIWGLCDSYGLVLVGRPLWREVGSFSGPSPLGLETIFYCLIFEASLFVASYDSQGGGGGIRPRLHTINYCCPLFI